ncbi:MAG TPA: hypothetical protein PKB10_11775, partial [Tepidisphaeraceae bacterium]|nr:hypothetical protein [Tepidisphaeraceae bacterium]
MTMSMTSLVGRRVYLDSNVLIYALNRTPSFAPVLAVLFERVDRGELKVSSSELALAELLVKPLREGNATAVEICRSLMIGNPSLDL